MNKYLTSVSLSLFLLCPALAADNNAGMWSGLVDHARKTLKNSEQNDGNKDSFSWGELTDRAGKAVKQFAEDGKGFDIMRKQVSRKYKKLTADENSTLTGHFYDLKQPVDKEAKPLRRHEVVQFIKRYMDSGWDTRLLEQYYSPDVELAAPYFYLPRCKASYAPESFECNKGKQEKHVAPQDWLVIYSGEVTAPESGTYRFVGMGDDTIVVRFNKEVVLESGWSIPSRNNMRLGTSRCYQQEITTPESGCALYQYRQTPHWNRKLGGIASGSTFTVEAGRSYPIQILISEIPGNEFGYCLLIEKITNNTPTCGIIPPALSPTLALFRTNDTTPDLGEIAEALKKDGKDYTVGCTLEAPPFAENSPIWAARISETAQKRNFVERVTANADEETAMGRRKERQRKEKSSSKKKNKK